MNNEYGFGMEPNKAQREGDSNVLRDCKVRFSITTNHLREDEL